MSENSPFKRGIVKELRPEKAQARVEFEDEDGVSSYWLSVNSPLASSAGSRTYAMPEIGSQVHCLIDWKGEDGAILGASYSDKDPPPATNADHIAMKLKGGLDLLFDKSAGTFTLKVPASFSIDVGGTKIEMTPAGLKVTAPEITQDGPVAMPKGFTSGTGEAGSTPAVIKGRLHAEQAIRSDTSISAPVISEGS